MSRFLVDTNLLIYGIDEDSKFFARSRRILDHSDYQLVTTSKNLVEFLTVVTRSSGYGLETANALEILMKLFKAFKLFIQTKIL